MIFRLFIGNNVQFYGFIHHDLGLMTIKFAFTCFYGRDASGSSTEITRSLATPYLKDT